VDCLLCLITFLDEKNMLNNIPKFVADSPGNAVPRICDADFVALIRKLNAIEQHCIEFQAKLDQVMDSSRATTTAVAKLNAANVPFPPLVRGGYKIVK